MRRISTLLLVAALGPTRALGDAPEPLWYLLTEDAGTVRVCLSANSGRTCPDQGLLRRDTATGEIVRVDTCDAGGCFLEQCVPAGTYQYGLAVPYTCQGARAAYAFGQLTVTGAAAGCTRTVAAPSSAAAVPWGASELACNNYHGPGSAGGCATSGAVLGLNGLVLAAGALIWRLRRRRG
jgi:hypothetical protein